jgi:hypothetical protein
MVECHMQVNVDADDLIKLLLVKRWSVGLMWENAG